MVPLDQLRTREKSLFKFIIISSFQATKDCFPMLAVLLLLLYPFDMIFSLAAVKNVIPAIIRQLIMFISLLSYFLLSLILCLKINDWLKGEDYLWHEYIGDALKASLKMLLFFIMSSILFLLLVGLGLLLLNLLIPKESTAYKVIGIIFFLGISYVSFIINIFLGITSGVIHSGQERRIGKIYRHTRSLLEKRYARTFWRQFIAAIPIFLWVIFVIMLSVIIKMVLGNSAAAAIASSFILAAGVIIMLVICLVASFSVYYELCFTVERDESGSTKDP